LDATVAILQKHSIRSGIKSILVETFQEALALNNYRPMSLEGLQFSLPYTIAVLLVEGEFGVKQMSLEYLNDPSVQKMADRVQMVVDPTLNQMFPRRRPARVTIMTNEGDSFTEEILEIHGEPGSPFALEGLRDKFFQLVSGRFDDRRSIQIYEAVGRLETLPSLEPLLELLRA
jgi:2-methylcitrate dehydratase PrpD